MSYAPVVMKKAKETNAPFFIELYVLELKTGMSYIAACDEDIVYNGDTYVAIPFSREEITRSADNLFDETTVSLGDVDDTKLAYILSGLDFRGCRVAIFKIQYPDSLKDPSIVLPVFTGYLDSPVYSSGVFSCTLKSIFPEIQVPKREYQLQCNSNFADSNCGICNTSYQAIVKSIKDNVLTLDRSFPDGFFQCGMVSCNGEARNVLRSSGNTVTVCINFLQDKMVGAQVNIERGCDKTKESCARFNNLKHFSGFPAVPFESTYR